MNWLRDNPFLAGLAAVTILGGSALIFLMLQAMGRFQETTEAYAQAVQKLHTLQNRSPFPNVENLEKSQALKIQYVAALEALRGHLERMQTPAAPGVSPQKFQDDLRAAVNLIAEKAAAAGVELPKGFYLGFGQYANSLPNERAAPALARQLNVINKIVTDLVDFRVKSIDSLDRLPLPEEASALPASPPAEGKAPRGKQPEVTPIGLARQPFDLAFTAEQGKLRVAFNSLLHADQFLLVRNLSFENTARVGPPISREVPASAATMENPPGASPQASAATNNLNVILGRELVKASLRIEMIDFPENGPPAK
ncbi:MAG TPA: Amuc_1100 family pilus-like protein [Terrimicrobiaceae bacterium]|nr:Amuc_1100 family pilus-like protein [Terrimicrobiaceae bacterium]